MSNATPRLSIILPVGADHGGQSSAFEDTLVSVLENLGDACEVVVVHDGTYRDPFAIGDEVRFAVADSKNLVDSIAAGCDASWGRYVHVLTPGFQATEGWCEPALAQFADPNLASIAPMIVDRFDGEPIAIGWRDTVTRLMDPRTPADSNVRSGSPDASCGAYLEASFWRREVLRSLTRACGPTDVSVATYAYRQLCQTRSWRGGGCGDSIITAGDQLGTINESGFGRARCLRAIERRFGGGQSGSALVASIRGLLSNPSEALGELSTLLSSVDVESWFEPSQVAAQISQTQSHDQMPTRRAA